MGGPADELARPRLSTAFGSHGGEQESLELGPSLAGASLRRLQMGYLYGDSSASPLESNFLAFLGSALDFCVHVLLAEERIELGRATQADAERKAADEFRRLSALGVGTKQAFIDATTGDVASRAARCAANLEAEVEKALRAEIASVQKELDRSEEATRGRETAQRTSCFYALETLLLRHDPPGTSWSLHLETDSGKGYFALLRGDTGFGLQWTV